MIEEIREVLQDPGKHVRGYDGQGYDIAGLVWFQGWNDMVNQDAVLELAEKCRHDDPQNEEGEVHDHVDLEAPPSLLLQFLSQEPRHRLQVGVFEHPQTIVFLRAPF